MAMSLEALRGLAGANAQAMAACRKLAPHCHGHPAELVDEIAVHRRELAIDIVRAMLARGASVDLVHRILSPTAQARACSAGTAWMALGVAERNLHRAFRQVLARSCGGEDLCAMLGLHYLRLELHHHQLASLRLEPSTMPDAAVTMRGCDA